MKSLQKHRRRRDPRRSLAARLPYDDFGDHNGDGAGAASPAKRTASSVSKTPGKPTSVNPSRPGKKPHTPGNSAFASLGPVKPKRSSRAFQYRQLFQGDSPPRVFVPTWVCARTGWDYPAILLSQLIYWNRTSAQGHPRLRDAGEENHRPWSPAYDQIFRQSGITKDKARRARHRLEHLGLIETVETQSRPPELYLAPDFADKLADEGILNSDETPAGTLVWGADVLVTTTGNQAIILSSILQWFEPNLKGQPKVKIVRDGHRWRANSYELLAGETGLSVYQAGRAIDGLCESKILVKDHFRYDGFRTLHVRPNVDQIKQRLETRMVQLAQQGEKR